MKRQKKMKTDDLSVNEPYIRKRYSKANELVGYQVQINYYDAAGKRRTDTMTFTVKEYGSLRKALNAAIFYRSERLAVTAKSKCPESDLIICPETAHLGDFE